MSVEFQTGYPLIVHLNHRKQPLNDVRIRRALALSVDRDELIKVLEKGKGAWQMPSVFTGYFTQEEARRIQAFNPMEAKRLVAEAGYPDGVPLEIQYPGTTEGQEFITLLELLQSQVKKGGINLEMKNVERTTYTRNLRAPHNFEFIIRSGSVIGEGVERPFYDIGNGVALRTGKGDVGVADLDPKEHAFTGGLVAVPPPAGISYGLDGEGIKAVVGAVVAVNDGNVA